MKRKTCLKSAITLLLALVFSFGIMFPNALIPTASAAPPEGKITVYVLGDPKLYNKNVGLGPDEDWALLETLEVDVTSTFGAIKGQFEKYAENKGVGQENVKFVGYKFLDYYTNRASGYTWNDADLLTRYTYTYNGEKVCRIFIPYQMTPVTKYETNGADNATDPAFYYFTSRRLGYDSKLPDKDPIRETTETGRDDHKFLGWYIDSELKTMVETEDGTIDNILPIWKGQGSQYVTIENPLYKDDKELYTDSYKIKQVTFYAKWNDAPLLEVADTEITKGEDFDPRNMIISASDKEDGENLKDNVKFTYIGLPTFDNPGRYNLTFTLTDSGGLQHKVDATLTVKEKEEPAPDIEVVEPGTEGDKNHVIISFKKGDNGTLTLGDIKGVDEITLKVKKDVTWDKIKANYIPTINPNDGWQRNGWKPQLPDNEKTADAGVKEFTAQYEEVSVADDDIIVVNPEENPNEPYEPGEGRILITFNQGEHGTLKSDTFGASLAKIQLDVKEGVTWEKIKEKMKTEVQVVPETNWKHVSWKPETTAGTARMIVSGLPDDDTAVKDGDREFTAQYEEVKPVPSEETKPTPSETTTTDSEPSETTAKPTESETRRHPSIWLPAGAVRKQVTVSTPKPNVVVKTPVSNQPSVNVPVTGEKSFAPLALSLVTAAIMLLLIRAKKH